MVFTAIYFASISILQHLLCTSCFLADLPVESVTDNSNTASRKQFGNTYAQLRLQNRMKYYANMYQGP